MPLKTKKDIDKTARNRGSNAKKAVESFDSYFGQLYGDRWPTLRAAMAKPSTKVAMWNRYCKVPISEAGNLGLQEIEGSQLKIFKTAPVASAASVDETAETKHHVESIDAENLLIDKPLHDEIGTPAYYLLDLASTLIVENLQVQGHHRVLDLCAAPGGKSIAISQLLAPASGDLTSNEANKERCQRLKRNLSDFLPMNTVGHTTTQRDATLWHMPNTFDRVLLDAPCSGERHLLQQPASVMATWAPAYTEGMAATQLTLLLRALETVKVGGRVVYSTCSISNAENDDVVTNALAKTRCGIKVAPTVLRMGEPTKHGWIVLPDKAEGWGPMYCCALEKVSELRSQSEESDDSEDEE